VQAAQAKTPVCQPVYQTGFHAAEKEFDRSWVDSGSIVNNFIEEDLLSPLPLPYLPQLLSSGNKAVRFSNFFLEFNIGPTATR